jgi:glycerol-3-phosphate dehydrogenase
MSNVTLIGLGAMGSALAKALVNGGHATTVWNRIQSAIDSGYGEEDVASIVKVLRENAKSA